MSQTSYFDVMHEGGPLGGQQITYAGEPKLGLPKHGGTYRREDVRREDGAKVREYRYVWQADDAQGDDPNARVPQDGDDASAMLERGPVTIPEGSSMAVGSSPVDADEDGGEGGDGSASGATVAGERGKGSAEAKAQNARDTGADRSKATSSSGSSGASSSSKSTSK